MNNITSATKETLMSEVKKLIPKLRKISTKKAKEVADSISYASNMYKKDATKVTKKDLVDLFNTASKLLAVPASASTEKATPAKSEKTSAKLKPTGKKVAEKEAQVENLTKKATPSKAQKSKKAEEQPVKEEKKEEKVTKKSKDFEFPETFTTETEDGDVTYELVEVSDMDTLCEYLADEDTNYILAFHWDSKDVKKSYNRLLPKAKGVTSFDNDLDLAMPVYISDDGDIVYLVSLYTEAFYDIIPTDVCEGDMYAGITQFNLYKEA